MSTIGIAAASYEGSLFSWKGDCKKENDVVDCELEMTSGFHCCAGSIRSLSTSRCGRYLACGGSDERIHIFNMFENSTLGELTAHTGAITCLDFFEDSYLLSGSDDNSICIWRTHDWMCVHILGGHKASVNCVAVHPSGKLAVSVAQDNTLKVWNLIQGRIAFTRRLKGSANIVKWLKPSGAAYMLVVDKRVEVYATSSNSITSVLQHNLRVNQADFFGSEGKMISVCEDKALRMFNDRGQMISLVDFTVIETRLRDFCSVAPRMSSAEGEQERHSLALATSNGKILLVDLDAMVEHTPSREVEINDGSDNEDDEIGCGKDPEMATAVEDVVISTFEIKAEPRLTCLSAWIYGEKRRPGKKVRKNKSKNANRSDEIEETNQISKSKEKKSKSKRKGSDDGAGDETTGRKKVRFVAEDVSESKNNAQKIVKKKKK